MIPVLLEIVIKTLFTVAALHFIYWMICERQRIKQNYHCYEGSHYDLSADRSFFSSSVANEETPLSPAESKAYEILSKVPDTSILGFTIREAIGKDMAGQDRATFRKLISELLQQCESAPAGVIKVIGEEGYCAVMNCKMR